MGATKTRRHKEKKRKNLVPLWQSWRKNMIQRLRHFLGKKRQRREPEVTLFDLGGRRPGVWLRIARRPLIYLFVDHN
jgi:hypothetical protein